MIRRPAFWLWGGACLGGALIAVRGMDAQIHAFPVGTLTGVALLAPTLIIGVWALRRLHPIRSRPLRCTLIAVGWGGFAAFGAALPANAAFQSILAKTAGSEFAAEWGASIVAPVNEETLKLLGVAVVALIVPTAVRGALDGFGYGALVGFGFLIAEDFLYVLNTIVVTGATQDVNAALFSFGSRVLGGVWWSHWAMTAVGGAGLGLLLARGSWTGAVAAFWGIALAMALHAWWDAPVLSGVAMMPLKGAPILLVAVVLYRVVRRRYLRRFWLAADLETERGVLVPGERHVLTHRKWRRKERWDVPVGEPRALLARLRTAQLDLLDAGFGGLEHDPRAADRLRADIRRLRNLLNATGRPPRVGGRVGPVQRRRARPRRGTARRRPRRRP